MEVVEKIKSKLSACQDSKIAARKLARHSCLAPELSNSAKHTLQGTVFGDSLRPQAASFIGWKSAKRRQGGHFGPIWRSAGHLAAAELTWQARLASSLGGWKKVPLGLSKQAGNVAHKSNGRASLSVILIGDMMWRREWPTAPTTSSGRRATGTEADAASCIVAPRAACSSQIAARPTDWLMITMMIIIIILLHCSNAKHRPDGRLESGGNRAKWASVLPAGHTKRPIVASLFCSSRSSVCLCVCLSFGLSGRGLGVTVCDTVKLAARDTKLAG